MKARSKWPIILSLAGLTVPALLVWVFYALVNREGARAWAEVRERFEAEGEALVIDELVPPAIPDEENFFAIPFLHGIGVVDYQNFETGDGAEKRARMDAVTYLPEDSDKLAARPLFAPGYSFGSGPDFVKWEAYLREAGSLPMPEDASGARAVLLGLDTAHGDIFEALAAGLDRPRARMLPEVLVLLKEQEIGYALSVPHYNTMTNLTKALSFRASAAIAAGNRETARESLTILFRINEAVRNDHLLIAQLVAVTGANIFVAPVWESLEARIWNEDDYRWLNEELAAIDFKEGFLGAMRSELVTGIDALEFLKENGQGEYVFSLVSGASSGSTGLGAAGKWLSGWSYLIPEGFFDQNKVTYADWFYRFFISPLKQEGPLAVIDAQPDLLSAMAVAEEERPYYSMFARIALPAMKGIFEREVYLESNLSLAKAAAAVEQYYLARGAYPRSLENLVPDFLDAVPLDPVSGEPIHYLRYVDGGRCRLWCIGWDGVDDGGMRTLREDVPERTKFHYKDYTGDWVWSYAR